MKRLGYLGFLTLAMLVGCQQAPSISELRQQGVTEFQVGHTAQAKEVFQQILAEHPSDALSLYYMGRIMQADKFNAMAIYYYQCAIDADPRLDEARRWLARAQAEAGQTGEILRFIPDPPAKHNS